MNFLNEKEKKRLHKEEIDFVFNKENSNSEDVNSYLFNNKNESSNIDMYDFNLNKNIKEGNDISLLKDDEKSINNINVITYKSSTEYEKECINNINSKDDNIFFLKLEGNCLDDLRITEENCDKLSNENNILQDNKNEKKNIKIKNIKENNNEENINNSNCDITNNKCKNDNINDNSDDKWINSNNNDIENINNNRKSNNSDDINNNNRDNNNNNYGDDDNNNNNNRNDNTTNNDKINNGKNNDIYSDSNNDVNNNNNESLIDISNNENIIQEMNGCHDHYDLNYMSIYDSEIDNRIKRKVNSLKQNEEIKKKKKYNTDNISSLMPTNTLDTELYLKEKYNYSSNAHEKKNDETHEKANIEIKDDNIIYADEVLKKYPRIFATRLPFEATKKDLEKHFSKYGKIIDIYVSKNLSNNKNKGFGFVSFETQESMDKALQDKLHIICGKEIVVDVASMRDNKSSHLFPLPSDHYLVKNQKNKKNFPSKTLNNNINLNKFNSYNKSNNIRIKSKNTDNYLMLQNFNNLNPNYNMLTLSNFKIKTSKKIYMPPVSYNINPKYAYSSYPYCSQNIENNYYYNFLNYKNSNNILSYNENMYNSKKIPFPCYVYDKHYLNQNIITKNILSQRSSVAEENNLKSPSNLLSYVKYNTNSSYVRKLPGGDEWNKRGYKLFVTKLNSVTTIDTLRNYFEKFGEIIDIYMPNDVCTNRPRGIAFVTFLDSDCVKKILSNKNLKHIIDGKEVVVDLADPETKNKKNFNYS
ncbi:nucleic acid binding protein, putative [Plasmodium relictum]|uniref:Nucleic acid binding protein, putative n=1 Tax=Plasmodium relictum TaxID=85471 RepID=A0A1J1H5V9_PLARL|nr:nucleic acid binding protein, putative [Plasmodium relictum]CRG99947.1 nucleic acid binding protein, putative [Plasmodium relictum]